MQVAFIGDGNNVVQLVDGRGDALPVRRSRSRARRGYEPNDRARRRVPGARREDQGHARRPRTRCAAPTSSTPTSGRAWARRKKRRSAARSSPPTRSTTMSSATPPRTRWSCTACRRIAARKSPTTCSRAAVDHLRSGREPPASPEGADGVARAGEHQMTEGQVEFDQHRPAARQRRTGGDRIHFGRRRPSEHGREAATRTGAKSKKIVLAYSGGLDTSVILRWLIEKYSARWSRSAPISARATRSHRSRARTRKPAAPASVVHRRPARGVRARLRLPDAARQRGLRGGLPARHLDRAAADRQAADRDRAPRRRRRRRARRHRQGQRSGALRAHLLRARARHPRDRAVAHLGPRLAYHADRLRRTAQDPRAR